jgi:hypothetical protein
MRSSFACLLICAAWLGAPAVAADSPAATPRIDWNRVNQTRAQVQALAARGHTAPSAQAAGGTKPAEAFANPVRAYPPSCLEAPMALGLWQRQPNEALTAQVLLPGDPTSSDAGEQAYSEYVNVYVFRVVCSGGKSATLLEIDRSSANEGNATRYPTFPSVTVTQGSAVDYPIRLADDPNTFFTATYALTPLIDSNVYVLENYYSNSTPQFDYNQPFTLYVDNLLTGGFHQTVSFPLPTYNPVNYADAAQPLPISGYLSSNWYDPNHSGEGMLVQVYDIGTTQRFFSAAWYTFDPLGLPFWLIAAGSINIGDRAVNNLPTYYYTGGGFAGNFGASANQKPWGTMSFQFPDCNTMVFSYSGSTDSQTNGPRGSGTRTWTRLANINGIVCE